MQIKKINDDLIQYHFEINKDDFDVFVEEIYNKVKSKVELKGFRKGFVTRDMYEKHFDPRSLYDDAFSFLVQKKLKKIFEQNKEYDIIGEPKIINFNPEDLLKKKDFFNFGIEFMLKPEIKVCDYKNIPAKNYNLEITDEEVEKKIDVLFKNDPILESKEKDSSLESGDFAIFDFKGYLNDQLFEGGSATNYTLEIGSNQFIPGFETGMIALKRNEEKDINICFPTDYAKEELAGKEVVFKVLLHDIKRKKDVVLNDELVKSMKFPNINNVSEFKKKIKEELEIQKKYEVENKRKEEILEFLVQKSNLKISQFLIDEEAKNLKKELEEELKSKKVSLEEYLKQTKLDETKFSQEMQEQALNKIKLNFLLDEIGTKEKIEISSEELEATCQQVSTEYKTDIQIIKTNSYFVKNIKDYLIRQKVVDFLVKNNDK
ncbi:trigger factor [Candidatus Phytoplasma ziziphi]|uniref:trigger factor n=1 Tax=Ziziphus jujuba witches'-broom phytoplasma TaxID=135727 RepID=UPI001EE12F87|nr:trigger factor [Candidatus Phytoplasma ziziphi]